MLTKLLVDFVNIGYYLQLRTASVFTIYIYIWGRLLTLFVNGHADGLLELTTNTAAAHNPCRLGRTHEGLLDLYIFGGD